jgi:hypothetical protein
LLFTPMMSGGGVDPALRSWGGNSVSVLSGGEWVWSWGVWSDGSGYQGVMSDGSGYQDVRSDGRVCPRW